MTSGAGRVLPQELLRSDPDQSDFRPARVFPSVEERREELRRTGVECPCARDVLAGRVGAGQGPEVREANGDRDGPARAKALALESRKHLVRQRVDTLKDELHVERVHLEGL